MITRVGVVDIKTIKCMGKRHHVSERTFWALFGTFGLLLFQNLVTLSPMLIDPHLSQEDDEHYYVEYVCQISFLCKPLNEKVSLEEMIPPQVCQTNRYICFLKRWPFPASFYLFSSLQYS